MSKYLTIFKNKKIEDEYFKIYDKCLTKWPVPFSSEYIETDFGLAHIIKSGNNKNPALILLPGMKADSTMWINNIKQLSLKYYVIAIDILGDVGKSKIIKPYKNKNEASKWLIQVIDKLNINKFYLLGVSYGSFLAMNLTINYPNRINKLVIISPTVSFTNISFKFLIKLLSFIILPTKSNIENVLKWMNGNQKMLKDEFSDKFLLAMKYGKYQVKTLASVFKNIELSSINCPVLLLIGKNEVVVNVNNVIQRAKKYIKNITINVVSDSSHTLSYNKSKIVDNYVLEFLNTN